MKFKFVEAQQLTRQRKSSFCRLNPSRCGATITDLIRLVAVLIAGFTNVAVNQRPAGVPLYHNVHVNLEESGEEKMCWNLKRKMNIIVMLKVSVALV